MRKKSNRAARLEGNRMLDAGVVGGPIVVLSNSCAMRTVVAGMKVCGEHERGVKGAGV